MTFVYTVLGSDSKGNVSQEVTVTIGSPRHIGGKG